jgi:hypothetical protein
MHLCKTDCVDWWRNAITINMFAFLISCIWEAKSSWQVHHKAIRLSDKFCHWHRHLPVNVACSKIHNCRLQVVVRQDTVRYNTTSLGLLDLWYLINRNVQLKKLWWHTWTSVIALDNIMGIFSFIPKANVTLIVSLWCQNIYSQIMFQISLPIGQTPLLSNPVRASEFYKCGKLMLLAPWAGASFNNIPPG